MKNSVTILLRTVMAFAVVFCFAGCDGFHYHPVQEDRTAQIGEWSGIALDGVGEVIIFLNSSNKVIVTAHADIIGYVTTKVDDMDILRIGTAKGAPVGGKGPISVEVHTQSISNIELVGNGKIRIMSGDAVGKQYSYNSNSVNANRLYVAHYGIGDISAHSFAANTVVVKHYGRGRVMVTAISVLNVHITTNQGEILYGGDPEIRTPVYINDPIFDYDDAFNENLWKVSDGNDDRIKRDTNQPQDITPPKSVVDPRDGQEYLIVKIGGYTWMAENINYAMPNNAADSSWCNGNDQLNCNVFGRLYNWNAAASVCGGLGSGWRLPARKDWDDLAAAAGGSETAGAKLKRQAPWNSYEEIGSTNEFGFSALPSGYRDNAGSFIEGGTDGLWWTADEHEEENRLAYSRWMRHHNNEMALSFSLKEYGFSVRCVRDYENY